MIIKTLIFAFYPPFFSSSMWNRLVDFLNFLGMNFTRIEPDTPIELAESLDIEKIIEAVRKNPEILRKSYYPAEILNLLLSTKECISEDNFNLVFEALLKNLVFTNFILSALVQPATYDLKNENIIPLSEHKHVDLFSVISLAAANLKLDRNQQLFKAIAKLPQNHILIVFAEKIIDTIYDYVEKNVEKPETYTDEIEKHRSNLSKLIEIFSAEPLCKQKDYRRLLDKVKNWSKNSNRYFYLIISYMTRVEKDKVISKELEDITQIKNDLVTSYQAQPGDLKLSSFILAYDRSTVQESVKIIEQESRAKNRSELNFNCRYPSRYPTVDIDYKKYLLWIKYLWNVLETTDYEKLSSEGKLVYGFILTTSRNRLNKLPKEDKADYYKSLLNTWNETKGKEHIEKLIELAGPLFFRDFVYLLGSYSSHFKSQNFFEILNLILEVMIPRVTGKAANIKAANITDKMCASVTMTVNFLDFLLFQKDPDQNYVLSLTFNKNEVYPYIYKFLKLCTVIFQNMANFKSELKSFYSTDITSGKYDSESYDSKSIEREVKKIELELCNEKVFRFIRAVYECALINTELIKSNRLLLRLCKPLLKLYKNHSQFQNFYDDRTTAGLYHDKGNKKTEINFLQNQVFLLCSNYISEKDNQGKNSKHPSPQTISAINYILNIHMNISLKADASVSENSLDFSETIFNMTEFIPELKTVEDSSFVNWATNIFKKNGTFSNKIWYIVKKFSPKQKYQLVIKLLYDIDLEKNFDKLVYTMFPVGDTNDEDEKKVLDYFVNNLNPYRYQEKTCSFLIKLLLQKKEKYCRKENFFSVYKLFLNYLFVYDDSDRPIDALHFVSDMSIFLAGSSNEHHKIFFNFFLENVCDHLSKLMITSTITDPKVLIFWKALIYKLVLMSTEGCDTEHIKKIFANPSDKKENFVQIRRKTMTFFKYTFGDIKETSVCHPIYRNFSNELNILEKERKSFLVFFYKNSLSDLLTSIFSEILDDLPNKSSHDVNLLIKLIELIPESEDNLETYYFKFLGFCFESFNFKSGIYSSDSSRLKISSEICVSFIKEYEKHDKNLEHLQRFAEIIKAAKHRLFFLEKFIQHGDFEIDRILEILSFESIFVGIEQDEGNYMQKMDHFFTEAVNKVREGSFQKNSAIFNHNLITIVRKIKEFKDKDLISCCYKKIKSLIEKNYNSQNKSHIFTQITDIMNEVNVMSEAEAIPTTSNTGAHLILEDSISLV